MPEITNAMIAEIIFGWHRKWIANYFIWVDSCGEYKIQEPEWHPTTDISQAFQVVERMRELGFVLELENDSTGYWFAVIIKHDTYVGRGEDKTPAMAICKAAIEALSETT